MGADVLDGRCLNFEAGEKASSFHGLDAPKPQARPRNSSPPSGTRRPRRLNILNLMFGTPLFDIEMCSLSSHRDDR